ncbi:glycosyltransferase [Aliarcobacter butzleri]|uniref:glycosyltransferase n=1 Tax=Aliarcobacter butzleri TaxID=28197 RepID=UPI00125EB101|nr:glycosyltransferase [Aliarcobacter butzleri]MCT7653062.1 glycosyltransferase [Aliarcobacter butzleri]
MEKYPKCSIIISVYKDTDSLDLILESLCNQTIIPDEIIISEDGNSIEMSDYVKVAKEKYKKLDINHLFQEDIGWRKNIALNRAIVASKYEYLIFIDGDCVPYSTFIEGHISNAQRKIVLCGKRMELGPKFSLKIKERSLKVINIEKNFLWYLPNLITDGARHPEDGFFLKNSFILNLIHKRYVRHIIGCNFSCYKEDFFKINGFNEDFINPSEGEDVDPSWRFRKVGVELKSVRLISNIAHLYHEKRFDDNIGKINREIMNKTKIENVFQCKNGIEKL